MISSPGPRGIIIEAPGGAERRTVTASGQEASPGGNPLKRLPSNGGLAMTSPISPAETPNRPHLPLLDGVRGCAILLVLATHLASGTTAASGVDDVVLRALRAGWMGVDLFFVLSGFLITGILLDSRRDPHYFRVFFARRALRILPLYWLYLLLLLAAAWRLPAELHRDTLLAGLPWHATYLTNVIVAIRGWDGFQTGHLWSLSVEEQFYLAWPTLVLVAGARRLRGATVRLMLWLPAVRAAAVAAGVLTLTTHLLTPFRADSFGAGALLAILIRDEERERLLPRLRLAGTVAIGLLLAIALHDRGLRYSSPLVRTSGYTLLALGFASLVERALHAAPGSALARTLGSRLLRSVGRYSYSIYLFHPPVLLAFDTLVFDRTDLPVIAGSRLPAFAVYSVAFTAVMWVIGFTTWWTFERHFLRLKRHFPYSADDTGPGAVQATAKAA